jgi:serine/threonine protein kinase
MNPPNWERIQEIYHAALELPRNQRDAFVEKECAGDADMRREVNSLLEAHDATGGILNEPVFNVQLVPDNLIRTTIGNRYRIEKELGHGTMSHLYLGADLTLKEQLVVIKILSQSLVQNSYARQKFEQEVEALLRLKHSGVVKVENRGELPDGRPYIVMEYVDGDTLGSRIPPEGMNFQRAASILKQIGDALDHVHDNKIFHRDLKPDNIMLKRGTDSVVLIDFGIAKVQDSLIAPTTVNGTSPGTLVYMSPEQLGGQTITAASDVYSMAVVAHEMVTGRRPFYPNSRSELSAMQRAGVPEKSIALLRPKLSRRAGRVIVQGLSFKAKRRYDRAGDFCNELAAALKGERDRWRSIKWFALSGALLAVLSLAAFFAARIIFDGGGLPPRPKRSFNYWLTVQRLRDGNDYQDPYKSNGDALFDSGDKFRLNVSVPESGYVYVVDEGPPTPNKTSFTMLYPRPTTNDGSATLGTNQTLELDWIVFRGPPGAENLWIVWSNTPINELESVKKEAFQHADAGLSDQTVITVKEFLKTKQAQILAKTTRYKATQVATVRGTGDMLIAIAEIKHR